MATSPKRDVSNIPLGATGLIAALAEDYLLTVPDDASIEWVCNHSRNTQLALLHGFIDLALTYEREQEALAALEGWSITAGCAFHDHFCLAGPSSDPAQLQSATSLVEAFSRIAESSALFHSRADASATMWKERSIWAKCSLKPWDDPAAASWYQTSLYSPYEALTTADAAGAYLLIDRSTLLRQTASRTIHNTTIFFEPTGADDILMNSCYALFLSQTSAERATAVARFIDYLFSDRGQRVIASFGKEELGGFPLFAPVRDGFAASFLRGGTPQEGQWKISTENARP
jgi:tungstate transport system substrate-binding protein